MLRIEHISALNKLALAAGRKWRDVVQAAWLTACERVPHLAPEERPLLQQLRNEGGPDLLAKFKPRPDGYAAVGYLKMDQQEKFNLKRGWYVHAWRIVDANGQDMFQPWSTTKTDARELAASQRVYLVEQED